MGRNQRKSMLLTAWFCFSVIGCDFFSEPEDIPNVLPVLTEEEVIEYDLGVELPMAFLMDSLVIEELGSQSKDDFMAQLLGAQWAADISKYNLNIILVVEDLDPATGEAELSVGFGIGPDSGTLCFEPKTRTERVWLPEDEGLYNLSFELVSIYSEDPEGTTFNCNPSPDILDAVPLSSVTGFFDPDEEWTEAVGELVGCLTFAEAETLCTCVGECSGNPNEKCVGCPDGSAPLSERLGTIETTANCTNLMGEESFDLRVSYTAQRVPVPEVCQ